MKATKQAILIEKAWAEPAQLAASPELEKIAKRTACWTRQMMSQPVMVTEYGQGLILIEKAWAEPAQLAVAPCRAGKDGEEDSLLDSADDVTTSHGDRVWARADFD